MAQKKTQSKNKPVSKSTTTKQAVPAKKSTPYKKPIKKKERGTWLTILLVLVILHGLFAAILYSTVKGDPVMDISRPWLYTLTVGHFLANVVAAVGIWYWKKWGLYVYAASAIVALFAGLVSIGIWSVFYMILPVAILGWALRNKWEYFE